MKRPAVFRSAGLLVATSTYLSSPGLTALVDGNRLSRGRRRLHVVFLSPEVVGHVVVSRRLAGRAGAPLDVPGLRLAVAAGVGPYRAPCNRAGNSSRGVAAPAADLVPEQGADHGGDHRARE